MKADHADLFDRPDREDGSNLVWSERSGSEHRQHLRPGRGEQVRRDPGRSARSNGRQRVAFECRRRNSGDRAEPDDDGVDCR